MRSSSIIGGASVINILIGLLRTKVAAVVLGPAGIGLIGFLSNLMATAATVAAMGSGVVGTRQIAAANATTDAVTLATSRRALFWGTLALAVLGSSLFWLMRDELATQVLDDASLTGAVGWLALGVGFSVAAGSQSALLNGMRRIGDLARTSVLSALLATIVGVPVLLHWREQGLLAYLLLTPISTFLVGYWYTSRLPGIGRAPLVWSDLRREWSFLARLGMPVMLAGLVVLAGQLLVRTMVQHELGVDALGYFEAAWVISMTYAGFVLRAMGTDFYPRLTAVIHDPAAVNRLVNEQSEAALMLAGPVLLGVLALAPWVVQLLYSNEFAEAAGVLRWQIMGDILKVACFPLGYIILAAGEGRTFLFSDTLSMGVFVLTVWIGVPTFGLPATGIAFLLMYMVNLPIVFWLAHKRSGFRWEAIVWKLLLGLLASAMFISTVAAEYPVTGAIFGILLSGVFAAIALFRFSHKATTSESTGIWGLIHRIVGHFPRSGK
nr:O-antigen translocase [Luteimonas sp. MC1572]